MNSLNKCLIIILLLFTIQTKAQNVKDTVLNVVKTYCLSEFREDTLIINNGLKMNLGIVHFYTKVTMISNQIKIQNFTEELSFKKISADSSISIQNLIPDSECEITKVELINRLTEEIQKCLKGKNQVDRRWTYEFNHIENIKGKVVEDEFGYNLLHFLDDLLCRKK